MSEKMNVLMAKELLVKLADMDPLHTQVEVEDGVTLSVGAAINYCKKIIADAESPVDSLKAERLAAYSLSELVSSMRELAVMETVMSRHSGVIDPREITSADMERELLDRLR